MIKNSSFEKKSEDDLKKITDEVVKNILSNKHLKVKKILLYGSYARGTADGESDIDIMVLCENPPEEVREYDREIFRDADKVAFQHDIMIQTNVKNEEYFNNWADDLPYFGNVKRDGIVLYG